VRRPGQLDQAQQEMVKVGHVGHGQAHCVDLNCCCAVDKCMAPGALLGSSPDMLLWLNVACALLVRQHAGRGPPPS